MSEKKLFNAILAGALATTPFFLNLAEAKPNIQNDNGPTFTGKIREGWRKTAPLRRKADRLGGDVIQSGQNAVEDFKSSRRQRQQKECEQINYNSEKCQKLIKKIRN
jgi:hypothetical protein